VIRELKCDFGSVYLGMWQDAQAALPTGHVFAPAPASAPSV
jgi:hypothetical protein